MQQKPRKPHVHSVTEPLLDSIVPRYIRDSEGLRTSSDTMRRHARQVHKAALKPVNFNHDTQEIQCRFGH